MATRLSRLLCVLFAAVLLTYGLPRGVTQESSTRPKADSNQTPKNNKGNSRGRASNIKIESGYLFIDGKYLSPPYLLELTETEVLANGVRAPVAGLDFAELYDVAAERPGRRRSSSRSPHPQGQEFRTLRFALRENNVVALFSGKSPVVITHAQQISCFFRSMSDKQAREDLLAVDAEDLPAGASHAHWIEWLGNYVAPAELQARAEADVRRFDELQNYSKPKKKSEPRFDDWTYVLTVIGMVLVIMALGHLLSYRPTSTDPSVRVIETHEARIALRRSLYLVVLFSALDLAWTILFSQSGQMREINPIGKRLIDSPAQLAVFKAAVTMLAIGLLFGLRRFRVAQVGAWWVCLILTVVTVRWLTFSSLTS